MAVEALASATMEANRFPPFLLVLVRLERLLDSLFHLGADRSAVGGRGSDERLIDGGR
ncbi:hypothetical protein [Bradyrhizobium japonicum]|uniref:hypothetical protein n=1 Tax=Bradyrhizobium japonicum TaxID=375 RepID=UPI00339B61CF